MTDLELVADHIFSVLLVLVPACLNETSVVKCRLNAPLLISLIPAEDKKQSSISGNAQPLTWLRKHFVPRKTRVKRADKMPSEVQFYPLWAQRRRH